MASSRPTTRCSTSVRPSTGSRTPDGPADSLVVVDGGALRAVRADLGTVFNVFGRDLEAFVGVELTLRVVDEGVLGPIVRVEALLALLLQLFGLFLGHLVIGGVALVNSLVDIDLEGFVGGFVVAA